MPLAQIHKQILMTSFNDLLRSITEDDADSYITSFHICQGYTNVTLSCFCLKFCFIVIPSSFNKNHETEINIFRNSGTDQVIGVELCRPQLSVSSRDIPS